jgi:hypothetical protein
MIAAMVDKIKIRIGMLKLDLRAMARIKMENKPANCDQNNDLKDPICFEKTPPRKS